MARTCLMGWPWSLFKINSKKKKQSLSWTQVLENLIDELQFLSYLRDLRNNPSKKNQTFHCDVLVCSTNLWLFSCIIVLWNPKQISFEANALQTKLLQKILPVH